jgi:hypothetical protein
MQEPTTVNSANEQTMQITATGAEKQCYTVMLAITANEQQLPCYVVFKCKKMAKEKFPWGLTVCVQKCGWLTEYLVDEWIRSVWF